MFWQVNKIRYGYYRRGDLVFKHELGVLAESKTMGVRGILVSRSENLYGCDRYCIQPKADKQMKVPDAWWVDEEDIVVKGKGITVKKKAEKNGGPASNMR